MTQQVHYRPNARRDSISIWALVLVCFAILYGLTCKRTWAWQDSGIFQLRIAQFDLHGWLGLALAHPLFVLIGQWAKALPAGMEAWGMNFTASLGAAVALANVAGIVYRLTGKRWVALMTAAMLGVCHTMWWLATITETYTWAAAFFTAELWILISLLEKPTTGKLAALALVTGLAWCMHNLALLAWPVYLVVALALVARKQLPAKALAIAFVAWLVGASWYLVMIGQLAGQVGLGPAVKQALVGGYAKDVFNVTSGTQWMKFNIILIGMNLISALIVFACIGLTKARRSLGGPLAAALIAIAVIDIVFVARYSVADQFMFALPALVMVAIFAGLGLGALADGPRWGRKVAVFACLISLVAGPLACMIASNIATERGYGVGSRRMYRHEARYWLVPWKMDEDSAQRFATDALAQAGPDGIIFADNTAHPVLLLTKMQTHDSYGITIQYAGDPLPYFDDDPEGFIGQAGSRPIYAVVPSALDPGLENLIRLNPPGEGEVLYRGWWTVAFEPMPEPEN
jgi:hypothetical protein